MPQPALLDDHSTGTVMARAVALDQLAPSPRSFGQAFAAADLLVQTTPDGRILQTVGDFAARFGRDAASFLGEPVACLVAPSARPALDAALATIGRNGHVAAIPTVLSSCLGEAATFAAIAVSGPPSRLYFVIATATAADVRPGSSHGARRQAEPPETMAAAGADRSEVRQNSMRKAIANRRFKLQFQPIVGLADRRLHHYEALFRPAPTPLCPIPSVQDYVVFAETAGLIELLDLTVLDGAMDALRASPLARIAINVSGVSMQSAAFRAQAIAMIEAARTGGRLAGNRLLLELTETAGIADIETAASSIAAFRAHGVPVCIDDFGAGAAAFSYLRHFPVDYIKIDGVLMREAAKGDRERDFVAVMVEIARSTGACIIAEMIETEREAALMLAMGVTLGQGWLFGRPGPLPGPVS